LIVVQVNVVKVLIMSRLHIKLKSKIINYDVNEVSRNGVYVIFHTHFPSKLYIGSTERKNYKKKCKNGCYGRWIDHVSALKANAHSAPFLQEVVNTYGLEGIRFKVLENADENVRKLEQFYLDKLKPYEEGYNTSKKSTCITMTDEMKKQSSERMKRNNPMKNKNTSKKVFKTRSKLYPPKKILQYSKKGEFIKEWESSKEASENLKVDNSNINRAITGVAKSSANSLWFYKEKFSEKILKNKL